MASHELLSISSRAPSTTLLLQSIRRHRTIVTLHNDSKRRRTNFTQPHDNKYLQLVHLLKTTRRRNVEQHRSDYPKKYYFASTIRTLCLQKKSLSTISQEEQVGVVRKYHTTRYCHTVSLPISQFLAFGLSCRRVSSNNFHNRDCNLSQRCWETKASNALLHEWLLEKQRTNRFGENSSHYYTTKGMYHCGHSKMIGKRSLTSKNPTSSKRLSDFIFVHPRQNSSNNSKFSSHERHDVSSHCISNNKRLFSSTEQRNDMSKKESTITRSSKKITVIQERPIPDQSLVEETKSTDPTHDNAARNNTSKYDFTQQMNHPAGTFDPEDKNQDHDRTTKSNTTDSLFKQHWYEQITAIPNIITITRIVSSPLIAYWIIQHETHYALIGCCIAGMSDVADGYLARNYNMSTTLGTYLDPLADKILINVLSISLWVTSTLPTPLVLLWVMRDVALMTGTYLFVQDNTATGQHVLDPSTTPLQINPTNISKMNTALQFATLSMGICILDPITRSSLLLASHNISVDHLFSGLCWLTGGTTVMSGISYFQYSAFTEVFRKKDDSDK